MTTPQTELTYHGHPLNAHPVNMQLGYLAELLCQGRAARVILEPGDATRYEFLIAPVYDDDYEVRVVGPAGFTGTPHHLFAGRLIGGDLVASSVIESMEDEWQFDRSVEAISKYFGREGNEWSGVLFNWWFRKLWERIGEET